MSKLKKLAFFSCVLVLGGSMAHADSVTCSTNGGNTSCDNPPFYAIPIPMVTYGVSGNTISISALAMAQILADPSDTNVYAEQALFSDSLYFNSSAPGDTLDITAAYGGYGAAFVQIELNNQVASGVGNLNSGDGNGPSETYVYAANGFSSLTSSGNLSASYYPDSDPNDPSLSGSVGIDTTISRFHADGTADPFVMSSSTPEPATWGLMALAGLGLLGYRKIATKGKASNL